MDSMDELLRDTWGIGDDLREQLLAAFGGHIRYAYQALLKLKSEGDAFRADRVLSSTGLSACLENQCAVEHMKAIAEKGFSLVKNPKSDEGARLIAEENVGGVVDSSALGLWHQAKEHDNVVIASSHHMRYLIWRKMQAMQ